MLEFENDINNNHKYLFSGLKSQEDRERLLNTNDKLSKQNKIIMSAQQTIYDTENIGNIIISELQNNKEKIKASHTKVNEFNGMTDTARRLLNSINKREIQQRWILFFVTFVIISSIIIGLTQK
jgi:hypothetical protein